MPEFEAFSGGKLAAIYTGTRAEAEAWFDREIVPLHSDSRLDPVVKPIADNSETDEAIRLVKQALDYLKKFDFEHRLPMVHFDDSGDYDMSVYDTLQAFVLEPLLENKIQPVQEE